MSAQPILPPGTYTFRTFFVGDPGIVCATFGIQNALPRTPEAIGRVVRGAQDHFITRPFCVAAGAWFVMTVESFLADGRFCSVSHQQQVEAEVTEADCKDKVCRLAVEAAVLLSAQLACTIAAAPSAADLVNPVVH
ncbi:MAG: hypothetical protein LCH95_13950 [Proteobacteria bacterium]|nr:hypothetical protein [Pseudomonadota bacterium]